MLGRNNGEAEIVVGKFEDSLAGVNEEIGDALGYNLTIISGSIASMPNTVDDAGSRGCGERLLP